MKLVYIGCVESSSRFLHAIYKETDAHIAGIVTKTISHFNSDHVSLEPFAKENKIDWLDYQDKDSMIEWIKERQPDIIYCFGWSQLLSRDVLDIPKWGIVGYHPALLPANRGRHPIIWALALGLKKTGSTFFYLTEKADAGDILNQRIIPIEHDEDARSLYDKMLKAGEEQVVEMTKQFIDARIEVVPQDHLKANHWRKRTKKDGEIDWRMSTRAIIQLVRALTKPYVGAHAVYKGVESIIWKVEVSLLNPDHYINCEPGKVIDLDKNTFTVKTGDGLIVIQEHEWSELPKIGEYL